MRNSQWLLICCGIAVIATAGGYLISQAVHSVPNRVEPANDKGHDATLPMPRAPSFPRLPAQW